MFGEHVPGRRLGSADHLGSWIALQTSDHGAVSTASGDQPDDAFDDQ